MRLLLNYKWRPTELPQAPRRVSLSVLSSPKSSRRRSGKPETFARRPARSGSLRGAPRARAAGPAAARTRAALPHSEREGVGGVTRARTRTAGRRRAGAWASADAGRRACRGARHARDRRPSPPASRGSPWRGGRDRWARVGLPGAPPDPTTDRPYARPGG